MTFATTVVGIITAVATMVTAVGGLLLALSSYRTKAAVEQVHKIVNQDKTDRDNFNRALVRALESHGIDVPEDQSLSTPPA